MFKTYLIRARDQRLLKFSHFGKCRDFSISNTQSVLDELTLKSSGMFQQEQRIIFLREENDATPARVA